MDRLGWPHVLGPQELWAEGCPEAGWLVEVANGKRKSWPAERLIVWPEQCDQQALECFLAVVLVQVSLLSNAC